MFNERNIKGMKPDEVSAIILSGGKSSRMGRDKTELTINGITLTDIQAKKCRAIGIEDVILAGYHGSIPGTRTIHDIIPGKGPLGGIHAGLTASENKACLVLSIDVPLVSPETLKELIFAHSGGVTMLSNNGKAEPTISIFDSSLAETAGEILKTEKTSVMKLTDVTDVKYYEYKGAEELLSNCNTPEDFQNVLKSAEEIFSRQTQIKTFFGRKNSVSLVSFNGFKAVKKVFAYEEDLEREKQMYQKLAGLGCAPEYFPGAEKELYISYVHGYTFLELLERQEQQNYVDESLWRRLARIITETYRKTGAIYSDLNLRNFLYDEEKDRIFLIDLESFCKGNIEEKSAELCAFVLLYNPQNTEAKKQISKVMQDQFCELLGCSADKMKNETDKQIARILERRRLKNK